jgi:hypothetical protein
MTRGGTRPGAGRKAGALSTKTFEIAVKVIESGVTPLQLMIDRAVFIGEVAKELEQQIVEILAKLRHGEFNPELMKRLLEMIAIQEKALSAAGSAAPYFHPRQGVQEASRPSIEENLPPTLDHMGPCKPG